MKIDTTSVLIIDDNPDDRYTYKRYLKADNQGVFEIHECEDGESGLTWLQNKRADCILLDYTLPGRNGFEILKLIRAKDPYIPIVMLTGMENIALAISAIREGAQNYIPKSSIQPDTLKRVIRSAIRLGGLEEKLAEQRASLELFTRAMAHDLKEPVRTICSYLEILEHPDIDPSKKEQYHLYIKQAALRMSRLIDSVYILLRPNEKQISSCDSQKALDSALSNLQKLIHDKGAIITNDQLPVVGGELEQVTRIFQNLIANAIQHADELAQIHISVAKKDTAWLFRVSDNGPGIAPEYLDKLFIPFKRIAGTHEQNLGLGLAICKKIVESYGGFITCQSTPGRGTSFSFTLPLDNGNKKEPSGIILDKHASGSTAHVLMIDDSEADLALNRYYLQEDHKLACLLSEETSGGKAIARLTQPENEPDIDLVLLDLNMPKMDGFAVLEEIRRNERTKSLPVIICTTSSYEGDKTEALRRGASGYLTKPLTFERFAEIIDTIPTLQLSQTASGHTLYKTIADAPHSD